jgi:hypothetical protein
MLAIAKDVSGCSFSSQTACNEGGRAFAMPSTHHNARTFAATKRLRPRVRATHIQCYPIYLGNPAAVTEQASCKTVYRDLQAFPQLCQPTTIRANSRHFLVSAGVNITIFRSTRH